MQQHIEQARHNQDFYDCIHERFDSKFFDWKITTLFYIAIHYLKALAANRNIDIGETHYEIGNNVNPTSRHKPLMPISSNAWKAYRDIFQYSRTARYEGIRDKSIFEALKKKDCEDCLVKLEFFKKYIEGQGITVTPPNSPPTQNPSN